MVDKYDSYIQLSSVMTEGHDFRVEERNCKSPVAVIAPHGGKIEPGTSELAKGIAGDCFNLYAFEGCRKSGNRDLHITSHMFDEPRALAIVTASQTVLGVHGRSDNGDPDTIYLGGLDKKLIQRLVVELGKIGVLTKTEGHPFKAENKNNICNRGMSGMGGQLEIPRTKRNIFLESSVEFEAFVLAVQRALK